MRSEILAEAFKFSDEMQISILEIEHKILTLMCKEHLKSNILNRIQDEIEYQSFSLSEARCLHK